MMQAIGGFLMLVGFLAQDQGISWEAMKMMLLGAILFAGGVWLARR
jgi:membrane-bound ClpP family serine protease